MSQIILRRKLSDEVLDRLEKMVAQHSVGASLPSERELMEVFGVGRPSIREALYALETKGLIQIRSGERPKVTRPTAETMLEQLSGAARILLEQPAGVLHFEQLRLFLEESIARYAAIHANPLQIADLQSALDANERAIPHARAFADTDVAFHRSLMAIPENPIFISVHQALVDWLISQHTPKADPPGNKSAFEGHRAVMEAILRHDAEAAGLAMRDHLMAARRRYATPDVSDVRI